MEGERKTIPVVRPGGSIISGKSSTFLDEVSEALDGGSDVVILDMKEVSFISKVAVSGLVEMSERLSSRGGTLALVNVKGVVRNLISLRRAARGLQVFKDEAEARRWLKRSGSAGAEVSGEGRERKPLPVVTSSMPAGEADVLRGNEAFPLSLEDTSADQASDISEAGLPTAEELARGTYELIAAAEAEKEAMQPAGEPCRPDGGTPAVPAGGQAGTSVGPSIGTDSTDCERGTVAGGDEAGDDTYEDEAAASASSGSFDVGAEPEECDPVAASFGVCDSIGARTGKVRSSDETFMYGDVTGDCTAGTEIVSSGNGSSSGPDDSILEMDDSELSAIMKKSSVPVPRDSDTGNESCAPVRSPVSDRSLSAGPETVFPVYDFEELAAILGSGDPRSRWFAARGLGRLGDPRAGELLEAVLSRKDEFGFIKEMARISLRRLARCGRSRSEEGQGAGARRNAD